MIVISGRSYEETDTTYGVTNFPHRPIACHSRDWQLVGSKGPRGLNRSSSAGQKEVCLLFFCWRPKSRTLLSFWSTPGAHGGSISPLVRLTSHPRCLWEATRRSLCALKIVQSSRTLWTSTPAAVGASSPSALSCMTVLTPSPLAPPQPLYSMGWTVRVTLKPVC